MKKLFPSLVISLLLSMLIFTPGLCQESDEIDLRLNRDFGYGGMGNDIQGVFSLEVRNPPADLIRVEFTIDGELLGEDSEPKFRIQFSTDSYPLGEHVLAAVGYTSDGRTLHSQDFTMDFVSAEAGWQAAMKMIGPILGILFGVLVLAFVTPYIFGRKQASLPPGTPRNYGIKGGAICPKCSRPFVIRFFSLNMGPMHKLDRCPFCGKWSFVRRRSIDELRAAEAAEIADAQGYIPETSEQEKLRKEIDDSRYIDS